MNTHHPQFDDAFSVHDCVESMCMYQRVDELRVGVVQQRGDELHPRADERGDHLGDEVVELRRGQLVGATQPL